jgi:pectate lyase
MIELIIVCRCRHGYFHVVNNDYSHWEMYAIGGSAAPTINSQGNRFLAPNDRFNKEVRSYIFNQNIHLKIYIYVWIYIDQIITNGRRAVANFQVTKHESSPQSVWKKWNWRSDGDMLLNGAVFTASGAGASSSYARASSLGARPSSLVSAITAGAGALGCKKGARC